MKSGSEAVLPASLTGGAAILSIIIGFISGVSPGIILIRGLIAGILTLLFVISVGWVVKKYLPELTEGRENEPLETSSSVEVDQSGNKINILMPEESPVVGGEPQGSPLGSGNPPVDSLDNKIAENADFMHNNKSEVSDSGPMVTSSGNDLDILPSLDTLELNSGSGSSSHEDLETEETDTASVSKPAATPGGEHDPAEIAKAVKTVLSRDQQK